MNEFEDREPRPVVRMVAIPNVDEGFLQEGNDKKGKPYIQYNYKQTFVPEFNTVKDTGRETKFGKIMLLLMKDTGGREVIFFVPSVKSKKGDWIYHPKFWDLEKMMDGSAPAEQIRITLKKRMNEKGQQVWEKCEVGISNDASITQPSPSDDEGNDPLADVPTVYENSRNEWLNFAKDRFLAEEKYRSEEGISKLKQAMTSAEGAKKLGKRVGRLIEALKPDDAVAVVDEAYGSANNTRSD